MLNKVQNIDNAFDFGHHLDTGANGQKIEALKEKITIIQLRDFGDNYLPLVSEKITSLTAASKSSLTRVLILGLSSPCSIFDQQPLSSICQFVFALKSLSRKLGLISIVIDSCHELANCDPQPSTSIVFRLRSVMDSVVSIAAFNDEQKAATQYKEFDGLVTIRKLPKINSLNYHWNLPETMDLGFQLKRHGRFLIIDKLSLPPDLSETVARSSAPTASGCNTMLSNKNLDF